MNLIAAWKLQYNEGTGMELWLQRLNAAKKSIKSRCRQSDLQPGNSAQQTSKTIDDAAAAGGRHT